MIDLVAGLVNDVPVDGDVTMRRLVLSMFACVGILAAAGCGTSVQVDSGFVILDTSPSGGAVNVDPEVELFVVMSQDVDSTTLASVVLKDAEGNDVGVSVTQLESNNEVISIAPEATLNRDARYSLLINGTLKSATGEMLDANVEKRFRTAP